MAAAVIMFMCAMASAAASDAPKAEHLGVATCAGGSCHGRPAAQDSQDVLHNEYMTWQRDDYHARAFRSLLTPRSLAIAKHLGISDPARSDTCLDCHTDNIPVAERGPRFSLSDGVGCEACHGGSERWITDHVMAHRSHAANLQEGMYATDDPGRRAQLCMGCHFGSADRPMTHAIMAAGHPPLLFELTTFTAIQPAHYRVDADYRQRKHYVGPAETWAIGQAVAVASLLDQMAAGIGKNPAGIAPDFYLYDCYSCHQPMQPESNLVTGDVGPAGSLPLAMSSLQMLDAILNGSNPGLAQRWGAAMAELHGAAGQEAQAAAIARLQPLVTEVTAYLETHALDTAACQRIAVDLARMGSHATYGERGLADQTVMAMTTLYHAASDDAAAASITSPFTQQFVQSLDAAYRALQATEVFDVSAYRSSMNNIEKSFK